jgi:hypothetical protein
MTGAQGSGLPCEQEDGQVHRGIAGRIEAATAKMIGR